MPLKGYTSDCGRNDARIISRDRNSQRHHCGINKYGAYVTHYRIDGVVIVKGKKCDFLLINEDKKTAYLIEIKGADLSEAARQLAGTEEALSEQLSGYSVHYRIVASKCKMQEIETASFKKFRLRWGRRLKYETGRIEEEI